MRRGAVWCASLLVLLAANGCGGEDVQPATTAVKPPSSADVASGSPTRILFIGNSLTEYNHLPLMVQALAASAGKRVEFHADTPGGTCLDDHWAEGKPYPFGDAKWDFVVLQQGPSSRPESRVQLIAASKRFADAIRKAGGKPALYCVWPQRGQKKGFDLVCGSYLAAAEASDSIFLPVGEAWRSAIASAPAIALYSEDGLHPTVTGSWLAALVITQTLLGVDAAKLPADFVTSDGRRISIDKEAAAKLRPIASKAVADHSRKSKKTAAASGDWRGLLNGIAKKHGIAVEFAGVKFPVSSPWGPIAGRQASEAAVARYAELFAGEFSIYSKSFIERTQLKRVALCAELAFAGQRRNAVPDYRDGVLYLDVERGSDNRTYLRKVLHHDFFHIVDYRDDGQLYRDDRWAALNDKGFKYGKGGKNSQNDPGTSRPSNAYPGFLNHYSTTGVEEDKAEVFAHMIVSADFFDERAAKDPVLAKKGRRIRELVEAFSPKSEGIWEAARKVVRN